MKRVSIVFVLLFWLVQFSYAAIYYVDINGNDASGDGSPAKPWRTLRSAVSKVPANQGHIIKLSSGTFIENGPIDIPTGVNIEGSGSSTVLKAASSFYYNPVTPGYSPDKFLIRFISSSPTNGGQSIKNLTVNGDGKKLHGGILFQNRDNILAEGLRLEYINFTGLWLWKSRNSRVTNCEFLNCAWASYDWCVGAFIVGDLENVEIDHVKIDEGNGYGFKALVFGTQRGRIANTKIHDCSFKVNPFGVWHDGQGPNIALELWGTYMNNVEIYNNYFDNNLSLACEFPDYVGKTVRVYDNFFDVGTRSGNKAYSIELCVDYAEIDHNFFNAGSNAIVNWHEQVSQKDWDIHHNVFYGLQFSTSHAIRTKAPITNVKFNNNTFESTGTTITRVIGLYTGASRNIEIKNNLLINSNTASSSNKLVYVESGTATLQGLQVSNNLFYKLDIGNVPGSYSNNITGIDPQINASGNRPDPYYRPKAGSPLIDKGINLGYPYSGSAPDIGAYEYGSTTTPPANTPPSVGRSSPANNASFAAGSSITLAANAADQDGSITRVEFFNGTTKLGEDVGGPYSFTWTNVAPGTYTITAKATDNQGATATSTPITITVVGATNAVPAVNITSPATNSNFNAGATITLNANATDSDGTISKVEFFNGTTKLGEDTSSPYSFTWPGVAAGTYSITARATDNQNGISNSTAVTIIVAIGNTLPTISLSSPANNSTYTAPASFSIS
ncbi:MAG TPA: Ig-like domain-containing protein, partial [Bacteroidia bacterium]|nr:Ig-like domain-containing protein [Bacteroidia bacterium]